MTTMAKPILSTLIVILLAGLVAIGLLSAYSIASADTGSGSGSTVLVGSGSGSSVDAVSGAAPIAPAPAALMDELKNLKEQYAKVRGEADKDAKMLLWAGLIAGVLKVLLSLIDRVSKKKPNKWMAWIALALSVPIALLSHYALGNSVFDSLVFAAAGPGAIVVHELLKVFFPDKPETPAAAPAK